MRPTLLLAFTGVCLLARTSHGLPSLDEAVRSRQDVYGEAAMRELNGASYEFFEKLLPPPRYVNADFHYYPIVLSARIRSRKHASFRTAAE